MIDYSTKKGADPYSDMGAFHDFIKKSLKADVNKTQDKKNGEGSLGVSGLSEQSKSNGKARTNQKGNNKTLASLKAELLSSPEPPKECEKNPINAAGFRLYRQQERWLKKGELVLRLFQRPLQLWCSQRIQALILVWFWMKRTMIYGLLSFKSILLEGRRWDIFVGLSRHLTKMILNMMIGSLKIKKIKSWLLSSMKPEIMKRYIRLSTSKEIWDSLKTAYFDENDEARIYSLNQKASRLRQNGRPLATYFGELTEIFQELDHFNKVSMECENDIKVFQKSTERQRVYVFLGGLDDGFDQVRGEVLRKDPPLGLQASYAYVRREADRKEAMKTEVDKSEPAAMAAKARGSPYGPNREGSQNRPGQTRTSQPSRDLLTRDNTEVLTFDYSHVARNELHEEQPLQSSRLEYTAPREGQQSTCHGDQLTTSGDGQQPVCFGHQSTEQVPEEQQTLQEEEEHPIGPTGFGLDDELQPTICNGTEQQLQQLPRVFPSDVISDPSINSSYLNSHNQSSSTPDATPLRRLPERINRGIPKPTYEADPKCKHNLSEVIGYDKGFRELGLPEGVVKQGLELIGGAKRAELKEKWKKLHVAELDLFVKRNELIRDLAKVILEALKSSKH
ncbi:hypothetical protein L3X38_021119 [Prunus dulcis]|uniref:Retrotransposon gag domain-containing protein n=1 Tax=Prunus dulcis TaxID=3755 RepID=A0AAD4VTN8_PRUDU|nr:hypothetical protein L3X38_021119 [Prunus dulcis]